MLKSIAAVLVASFLVAGGAWAQTCPAYTYTLTNGSTADASQVMANFNTVRNCVTSLSGAAQWDYLAGLTLSTAGSSATFGIAPGQATDSTNVASLSLATAYSKTTATWAVGSAAGSLDTGTIAANTWYHVFLIQRTDTGVVDVLTSLSATAPTLPSPYSLSRRIGSMKTDGSSQWRAFTQSGDEFLWKLPSGLDVSSTVGTTGTLFTLPSVPSGVKVTALYWFNALAGSSSARVLFTSPDTTSISAGVGFATALSLSSVQSGVGATATRTDQSQEIRAIADNAATALSIGVMGWIDARGKNN